MRRVESATQTPWRMFPLAKTSMRVVRFLGLVLLFPRIYMNHLIEWMVIANFTKSSGFTMWHHLEGNEDIRSFPLYFYKQIVSAW